LMYCEGWIGKREGKKGRRLRKKWSIVLRHL
jgi:hypothetical protein